MQLTYDQKRIIRFIAIAISIYLAWYFLFEFWILPHTEIHNYFTLASTIIASEFLNISGILPVYWSINPENNNVIIHHLSNGMRVVNVGHGCNSLSLMVLFSGFILAFPGKIKLKAVYIPAGIAVIFILNILRIVGLTWTWYFHHEYLFTALMYTAILAYGWVGYSGVKGKKNRGTKFGNSLCTFWCNPKETKNHKVKTLVLFDFALVERSDTILNYAMCVNKT